MAQYVVAGVSPEATRRSSIMLTLVSKEPYFAEADGRFGLQRSQPSTKPESTRSNYPRRLGMCRSLGLRLLSVGPAKVAGVNWRFRWPSATVQVARHQISRSVASQQLQDQLWYNFPHNRINHNGSRVQNTEEGWPGSSCWVSWHADYTE